MSSHAGGLAPAAAAAADVCGLTHFNSSTKWSKDFPAGQFVSAFVPLSLKQFKDESYRPIVTFIEEELGCHVSFRKKDFKDGRKRSQVTVKGLQAHSAWTHLITEIRELEKAGKIEGSPIPWHACPPANILQDAAAKEEAEEDSREVRKKEKKDNAETEETPKKVPKLKAKANVKHEKEKTKKTGNKWSALKSEEEDPNEQEATEKGNRQVKDDTSCCSEETW